MNNPPDSHPYRNEYERPQKTRLLRMSTITPMNLTSVARSYIEHRDVTGPLMAFNNLSSCYRKTIQ